MVTLNRPTIIIGSLTILILFYITGPLASRSFRTDNRLASNADARLQRWLEAVAPPIRSFRAPGTQNSHRRPTVFEKSKPLVPFSPFPLGLPATTKLRRSSKATTVDFVDVVYSFQRDIISPKPLNKELGQYKKYKPRNHRTGIPRPTFATFLSTRNGSIHDPYFSATMALVYQMLWSPVVSSRDYPFTVFVAPHIPQEQRDILIGAGALVRELELLSWQPRVDGVHVRFKDQFSKLNLWSATEFSLIAFMDADTFLLRNIDEVFELARRQKCNSERLSVQDADVKDEICDYVFAGVENLGSKREINGGFLILEPNLRMHERLLRSYLKTNYYDSSLVDQAFYGWQFSQKGAFPAQLLPRKYNGYFPQPSDEGKLSLVHAKTWAMDGDDATWLRDLWEPTWREMVEFFDSRAFMRDRAHDGEGLQEVIEPPRLHPEIPGDPRFRSPHSGDSITGQRDNDHVRLQKGKHIDDASVSERQQKLIDRHQAGRMVRNDKILD